MAGTTDVGYTHAVLWMKTLPWEDPKQFMERAQIYYAKNFKTPTMVIAGESDRRTPMAQSEDR
jgi:acylaminoacyl-peptidase